MRAGAIVIKYGDKKIRLVPSLLKESDVRRYRDWFDKVHKIKKAKREKNQNYNHQPKEG